MEAWINTKLSPHYGDAPRWHIRNAEEIVYANELLDEHLRSPVGSLRSIHQDNNQAETPGSAAPDFVSWLDAQRYFSSDSDQLISGSFWCYAIV